MNKREIILDFTSLLDVVMILLFFFILFSKFETDNIKADLEATQTEILAEAEEMKNEAENKMNEADKKMEKVAEKEEQVTQILEEAKQIDERKVANIDGIMEFNRGLNLKINLKMNTDDWQLDIYCGEDLLSTIPRGEIIDMKQELVDIIEEKGYSKDDTFLCNFIYDGTKGGSRNAYREASEIFDLLKKDYKYFYYSDIDSSIFNEEDN